MSTQIGLQQVRVSADRIGGLTALSSEQYSGHHILSEHNGPLLVAFEGVFFRYGRGEAGLKEDKRYQWANDRGLELSAPC